MKILIIDKDYKQIWRILSCTKLQAYKLKILIDTYNDIMKLNYDKSIICEKTPNEFIEKNFKIINIPTDLLSHMKNKLLDIGIL